MKLRDLLKKDTPSLSFEVFPPKTDTAFESVKTATEEIAKLRPAFMSVTEQAEEQASILLILQRTSRNHTVYLLLRILPVFPRQRKQ